MSKLAKALTAAAGNAGDESLYVEDVFSTYLYEGDGQSNRDIVNGVNLADNGGLVWLKTRSTTYNHFLANPSEFTGYAQLPLTSAWTTSSNIVTFNTDGFRIPIAYSGVNAANSTSSMSSWTFRKAEKFFDVVTYTGNGSNQAIAHNLGSKPGCVIIKAISSSGWNWIVFHQSLGASNSYDPEYYLRLNTTDSEQWGLGSYVYQEFDESNIYLRSQGNVNGSGISYVAYLFASDAGGYGADGSENIIKCGSFTLDGSGNASIACGFEPQWVLAKRTDGVQDWYLTDMMRGMAQTTNGSGTLSPNLADAEYMYNRPKATATGFDYVFTPNTSYIYIAIRRPMKTPESGTEVFDINTRSGNGTTGTVISTDVRPDANLIKVRSNNEHWMFSPRLLSSNSGTSSNGLPLNETTGLSATRMYSFTNNSYTLYNSGEVNGSGETYVDYIFSRASGFFDTVAYTGDGSSSLTVPHNLTVVPELILTTIYSTNGRRYVYHKDLGNTSGLWWNDNVAERTGESYWASTTPTSSNFYVGASSTTNVSSGKYISFMFATLDGVSKVGSYTGTGSNIDVDCGFSTGARFILIKRTDASGDWYVWDSERGIVAGNDPYLLLNVQNAEVTSTDYIDPLASGFTVTSSAPAALNASGGTYIFLAIAQELLWNIVFNQRAS